MAFSAPDIALFTGLFLSLFFEVFLVITYFEKRRTMKGEGVSGSVALPSVTIIVPCYNEQATVSKTLDSLLELDYPKNKLRIIAVNDGSTDGTAKILEQYAQMPQVSVYSKENGGKYTALNFGLSLTTSDLVGCLDSDSFVEPGALRNIATYFENPSVMAVTPSIVVDNPKNLLQSIQKVEYAWGVFLRKMLSYLGAMYVTPGPFSIFRTEVFTKLGVYKHAHHTEDFEIALRMQSNHYKIVNAHEARVYTTTPKEYKSLYKQRLRWVYGFLNNIIDYRYIFFKKRYGNLGTYILPMAAFSVFSALYFFFTFIAKAVEGTADALQKIATIGFSWPSPSFDWFFLKTDAQMFLVAAIIALSVFIIYISRKMTEGKFRFSMDIIYFMCLYGFLVPWWLMKALYDTAFGRKISWR